MWSVSVFSSNLILYDLINWSRIFLDACKFSPWYFFQCSLLFLRVFFSVIWFICRIGFFRFFNVIHNCIESFSFLRTMVPCLNLQKQSLNFAKFTLWHRCFPVNFVKFLRTPFLTEHLRWLLLNWIKSFLCNIVPCLNGVGFSFGVIPISRIYFLVNNINQKPSIIKTKM